MAHDHVPMAARPNLAAAFLIHDGIAGQVIEISRHLDENVPSQFEYLHANLVSAFFWLLKPADPAMSSALANPTAALAQHHAAPAAAKQINDRGNV